MQAILSSPAKDDYRFAGYMFTYLLLTDADISVVSRYRPVKKRNNNLTPDTYPK